MVMKTEGCFFQLDSISFNVPIERLQNAYHSLGVVALVYRVEAAHRDGNISCTVTQVAV